MLPSIEQRLANELAAKLIQVTATINLIDEGATIPFIARYRKEATGGLDDIQLRLLDERLRYLRELEDRRATIIASIEEQNKMTPTLLSAITQAEDKTRLEDLYLPYRKKRRTKAQTAHEAGLQPLADSLLNNPMLTPLEEATNYLKEPFTSEHGDNPGVKDAQEALDGAGYILIERFAENATLLQSLREYLLAHGVVTSKVVKDMEESGVKFKDYFDYAETFKTIPPHRVLALFRGQREKKLRVTLRLNTEAEKPAKNAPHNPCELLIAAQFNINDQGRPADQWLCNIVRLTWRSKCSVHLENELMNTLREQAETESIKIFALNLKALLLASPAGSHVTIGLDPGIRTGVKAAVIDAMGKVLETGIIYPHQPQNDWDGSLQTLKNLVEKHQVTLIAIGNGTGSRETDKLTKDLIKQNPTLKLTSVMVSEAGASVYSASRLASQELPDLDVSIRGAVSIARRLQDPLAELVKIDPKSIGVGQYQHDVAQTKLANSLDAVIEDCVNAVGVDVNTASPALLSRVSGLNSTVAQNIVSYRETEGEFTSRETLNKVPRLGDKAFEQSAGFLRIMTGDNPLDASAVHPESYPLVKKILDDIKQDIKGIIGNNNLLKTLDNTKYVDDNYGLPTVQDILKELEKPGRDPRPAFTSAAFKEGINELKDLRTGMILEGVITNVAAFGAFVDIGVHQDGLVHISALANTFVKDPHTFVRVGQIVKVKVLEVDEKRKRIALTMRLADASETKRKPNSRPSSPKKHAQKAQQPIPSINNAMAVALAKLKR